MYRAARIFEQWRRMESTSSHLAFAMIALALGLLSLALTELATTARSKLWLGPQTLVLGGIGLGFAMAIAATAWRSIRVLNTDLFDQPLLSQRAAFGVMCVCLAVAAAICRLSFDAFPNSADEYGFLFQAETFLRGRLWNPLPPDPILFEQNYIIAKDGMWVSQYLPGWPAILALFEFVRLPAWLATQVCGGGLLFLLWLALRLECPSRPLCVALLLAYATSDFFLLNSATYFSHCASALMVVGCIVCMLRAGRDDVWYWPVAAGAFVGFALLCRIDSGMLAATAAIAAWIEYGHRGRTLLLGLAGAAPPLVIFAGYNFIITGNPLLAPTIWAGVLGIGPHGLAGVEAQQGHWRMAVQTLWRLGELADTASLLIPALYVAALVQRVRTRRLRFYDIVPLTNFVLFLIFPDLGGFQMGPRYWFDGFVAMHVTVASAFSTERIVWQRFAVACGLLLIPVSLARLPSQVRFEAHVMRERSSVYRLAQSLPAGRRTVVLVNDFFSAWNDRYNRTSPNFAKDLVRNGVNLDRSVLYGRGDVPDAPARACALYPDAAIFKFHLDRGHPDGSLQPVSCSG